MDDQNKKLILATVLSFLVIFVWFVLFPPPEAKLDPSVPLTAVTEAEAPSTATLTPAMTQDESQSDAEAPRIIVDTPRLAGSISLLGGRINDLSLKTYRETLDPDSPMVRLLSPVGQEQPYYAVFGWGPSNGLTPEDLPSARTEWQIAKGDTLSPDQPVTLTWVNTKGMTFIREIAVDDRFMFTITDSVQNVGTTAVSLFPYGIVARHGKPVGLQGFYVLHEGIVGRTDGTLTEQKYKDLEDLPIIEREGAQAEISEATKDGWIGFTDKYWMTTLIPEQGRPFTTVTKFVPSSNIYQTETRHPVQTVAPGATISSTTHLFAGAKEWETIRAYEKNLNVPGFIDSIDWGWFFFFTKPIFQVLHWLHGLIGNMGLAIIALTFVLKLLVLPLAYKSYVSMAKMKELQPELEALKERVGDDKQRMQKEMMNLYKEKKINPAAGCLPILIQIPIFFSLYKVIFVTIELRHAPFFGWLKDLSAPDSSSLYNFFGLLPLAPPPHPSLMATIFVGMLPILLGSTMWLQQKLNPAPADPIQRQVFSYMPWIFMFMLGSFASGLVIYWITNNIITFSQQYIIMRSHGHKPDIFGNIRSSFKNKPIVAAAANKPTPPKGKTKK
ncbi:MAG: membrane protein insertase YidC [Rhodobacteraceae bacterium]|nr:membrane protein insertase YidC [Paracoccaceae bacterium]